MAAYPDTGSSRIQRRNRSDQVIREVLVNLEAQARGMWRYRWRAVVVMWVVSIGGWIGVYSMPDIYEADARIFVDTENVLRPLLSGIATSSDVISEVTIVTREMLSRPILAKVARSTDLDLRVQTDEQFENLLTSLQGRIKVNGSRDNVFSIAFQDPDRNKAIAVVDSLVNTFVEKSLGADRTESSKAQIFLQQQIDEYEARLTAAENRLAGFKRENVAFMPDQQGDYFSRLQAAESALGATLGRLRLAEGRRAELLRQLEGEEPVFGIMPSRQPGSSGGGFADAKIRDLELQLKELRLRYTDKHPRIGQILETIEMLKKQQEMLKRQQEEELAAAAANGPGKTPMPANPLDMNPVYQNMRIQLSNTEVEIASLRAEREQQQQQVDELKMLVDTVPKVEVELGRLNRDYGVVKSKYEQLLAQLETANIGEDVDKSIDDVQFRIIEPPFAELTPTGPQRQLFLIAVFFGAIGLGGALAFLLNQLHPVFFSARSVTAATGIPVLGTLNFMMSPEDMRDKKSGRLRFAGAICLLIVSFALVSLFADELSPALRSITRIGS